jgi:hypothetical protein
MDSAAGYFRCSAFGKGTIPNAHKAIVRVESADAHHLMAKRRDE